MTDSNLIPFAFDGKPIRVTDRDGNPWFVAADVCRMLELKGDPGQHTRHLDDDEKGLIIIQTLGGPQKAAIVSESGLYALGFKSRKPEAKRLRKWVTSEILPSIRKTGGYGKPQINVRDPAQSAAITAQYQEWVAELQAELAVVKPKAALLDELANRPGSFSREQASKWLRRSAREITTAMKELKWIYQRPGEDALGTASAEKDGYITHAPVEKPHTGEIYLQVRLTMKGLIGVGMSLYKGDCETLWPLLQHAVPSNVKLIEAAGKGTLQ